MRRSNEPYGVLPGLGITLISLASIMALVASIEILPASRVAAQETAKRGQRVATRRRRRAQAATGSISRAVLAAQRTLHGRVAAVTRVSVLATPPKATPFFSVSTTSSPIVSINN